MHYAGDAVLAKFGAVIDAVSSATDIQEQLLTRNADLPNQRKVQFRIGVNLGDVIEDRGDIYGEGVNIAARLEGVADPGGVCVSASVYEQIKSKVDFQIEDMGEQDLKNIAERIRAYRVTRIPTQLSSETFKALTGEHLELPDKPSIAVLPFQNISGDPEQEYFADGMSEEIITALSRVPNLIVISRNSTFIYKGRAVDVRQVGREFAVGHVLEGSIRKLGDRIRITAQLVNTLSGDHLWAERYDRKLNDIFDVQDEITHNIVVELQIKLVTGESSRLLAKGTKSIEAWELTIRSGPLIGSNVRDDAMVARKLLEQALELDNSYAAAWALLGWSYWQESVFWWCSEPEKPLQMAFDAAQKAISADAHCPDGYSLLGDIYMVRSEADQAIAMSEKAVELAPGNSRSMALLGFVLIAWDREKEGIRNIQRAIRLCPFPPAWYLMVLGAGFHLDGDNESAFSILEQAVERDPDSHLPLLWLVSTLVEMGRLEEARTVSKAALDIEPNFSAVSWMKNLSPKVYERTKTNLLAAGFPEYNVPE